MPARQLSNALASELPHIRQSNDDWDRTVYSRDTWPLMQIRLQRCATGALPGVVAWPRSTQEVTDIYRFAAARRIPVTPVGAGSGVCGGAIPEEDGLIMDLKLLDGPIRLAEQDCLATAPAGWVGQNLEDELNRRGFTGGHFPSSIMCSTLGGWMAARGAGQLSTRYGKFEDRVRGMEWVFPDGSVDHISTDGWSEGVSELLMGSEGTLGVGTEVTFRVDPLPAARVFRAYHTASVAAGLEYISSLLQAGVTPAAVRLYDPLDTFLKKSLESDSDGDTDQGGLRRIPKALAKQAFKRAERFALTHPALGQRWGERMASGCLLVFVFEGDAELVAWQARYADQQTSSSVTPLGEAPARLWYRHRYDVSFKQSAVYSGGGFVDTMEVAYPWSKVLEGYRAVREALAGEAIVLAHFSHVYTTGASIYFTFSGHRAHPAANEDLYREVWRRGLDAVVRTGGTITHHHGVGLLKARWMNDEWGAGHGWLQALKRTLDPAHIANPGKLGI